MKKFRPYYAISKPTKLEKFESIVEAVFIIGFFAIGLIAIAVIAFA